MNLPGAVEFFPFLNRFAEGLIGTDMIKKRQLAPQDCKRMVEVPAAVRAVTLLQLEASPENESATNDDSGAKKGGDRMGFS